MKNLILEKILSNFFDNEINQFTSNEFRKIYFSNFGENNSPTYIENAAYSALRILQELDCITLKGISVSKKKIYQLNLTEIKKHFPDLVKEIDFSKKKEKEKK